MMLNTKPCKFLSVLFLFLYTTAYGQVRLPRIFSDGMVLQRETEVKIWGWAKCGEKISIKFIDSQYTTTADNKGDWHIMIPKLEAGGPYEMSVKASNSITINDIMIGDVWICSGQSNMELNMQRVRPLYEDEIAASENPNIRYFEVPDIYNFNDPQKDFPSGEWKKANPENVLRFSATSYFFGNELYNKYQVPVGLINSALGGSPVESWISEEGLKEFPNHYDEAMRFKDSTVIQDIKNDDKERIEGWYKKLRQLDKGLAEPAKTWYSAEFHPIDWETMEIPGFWSDINPGTKNGVVWFRKGVEVPASMAGKPAKLILGRIIDADSTYVNGIFVGTTTYQYPPRRYTVPPNVLKKGKNIIVVRVISSWGKGGFVIDKPYKLVIENDIIDLRGEWQYKLGAAMEPLRGQTFIRWKPMGLYNAMIAPLLNYNIKGVIWYQGESNAERPLEYRRLFPALIRDWRNQWKQGNFPFIYVQLPNFMEPKSEPSESNWALLREAQLKTLSLPNTAMAVTIDIGEWNDIHPLNKKDVGMRLALAAQKVAYGEELIASGPVYQSMKVKGNKVELSFSNSGSGLMAKDNTALKEFAIAGADRKFVWAKAIIQGDKILVWHDNIANPVAVRYAWADNPVHANLYNKENLPASPFRTDEDDYEE